MSSYQFFSIIIPAHNEERYIEETLSCVQKLDYPPDRFETILIENGSTDATFAVAKPFASDNTTVISLPKSVRSVSRARNAGVARMNTESDWVVFLDADTLLTPTFLRDLNTLLTQPNTSEVAVGTASILPSTKTLKAHIWFKFYDFGHRLTKTSYSLFMVRADVLKKTHFDESMATAEELKLITEARAYGPFFFFKTNTVSTSIRRFEQEGWWKVFFSWVFIAMLPESIQRRIKYKVIR